CKTRVDPRRSPGRHRRPQAGGAGHRPGHPARAAGGHREPQARAHADPAPGVPLANPGSRAEHPRSCPQEGEARPALARFFFVRPIFAWVVSIVILLGGGVAYFFLPTELYPNITPPTVQVTAAYPGANAEVVANTVAAPIEQQVNGVERMLYMSSQSTNDGNYTLTITFELGPDGNLAQG